MEKFLFLIREDIKKLREGNEEELFDAIREMDEWVRELAKSNNYLFGDALQHKGNYVGKDYVLSDGPFIEAKEGVSGFIFVLAENQQDAVAMAKRCPAVLKGRMAIEVRPVRGLKDVKELGDEQRPTGS